MVIQDARAPSDTLARRRAHCLQPAKLALPFHQLLLKTLSSMLAVHLAVKGRLHHAQLNQMSTAGRYTHLQAMLRTLAQSRLAAAENRARTAGKQHCRENSVVSAICISSWTLSTATECISKSCTASQSFVTVAREQYGLGLLAGSYALCAGL